MHQKRRAVKVAPLSLASRIGIGLLAQRQPDRHAGQVERLAQRIDQIPPVCIADGFGAGAEHDEARWPGFGLGDVIELDAAARDRGRRMGGERVFEPAVERIRRGSTG